MSAALAGPFLEWRHEDDLGPAVALVQAACVDRVSFKPAPIPASLAQRLG